MGRVSTPDKMVAMAITFDKTNRVDNQLTRSFDSDRRPENKNAKCNASTKRTGGPGTALGVTSLATQSETVQVLLVLTAVATDKPRDCSPSTPSSLLLLLSGQLLASSAVYITAVRSPSTRARHCASEEEGRVSTGNMGLHVGLTTSGLVTSDTSLSIEDLLQMNRRHVALPLEHVYYSPTRPNLFSQSVSREQSFNVDYDDEKATYPLSKNLATALQAPLKSKCGLWMFTAHNEFLPGENNPLVPDPMVNFALREGVADLRS
ncbi:hypothetical protein PC128_g10108 [Phytophthora cactorum]|nr:hypothetical protein PC128_g10108 [Phytophthora cactorum]